MPIALGRFFSRTAPPPLALLQRHRARRLPRADAVSSLFFYPHLLRTPLGNYLTIIPCSRSVVTAHEWDTTAEQITIEVSSDIQSSRMLPFATRRTALRPSGSAIRKPDVVAFTAAPRARWVYLYMRCWVSGSFARGDLVVRVSKAGLCSFSLGSSPTPRQSSCLHRRPNQTTGGA